MKTKRYILVLLVLWHLTVAVSGQQHNGYQNSLTTPQGRGQMYQSGYAVSPQRGTMSPSSGAAGATWKGYDPRFSSPASSTYMGGAVGSHTPFAARDGVVFAEGFLEEQTYDRGPTTRRRVDSSGEQGETNPGEPPVGDIPWLFVVVLMATMVVVRKSQRRARADSHHKAMS